MRSSNERLIESRDGARAIEYGLIAAIVAVVIIGGLQTVGPVLTGALAPAPGRLAPAH
ncbi:MAG: Flp/Fap pilin component [Rhodospirillales bacterium]|jgi:pilus assembly protein Flp/PilA|nr:Flp/Fap pilin component [Rhodospirillales bacterium]